MTIRKIRITSITSINGTRLISRGSFSLAALEVHALRSPCTMSTSLEATLLHLDDEGVDLVAEVAVEDQRRDRDRDAERGVVERDRDAVRELLRVGAAGRRLRAEDLDHADHGAEQAEQRRRRGDGAEGGEEALEVMRHRAPGLLDRLLHHVRASSSGCAARRRAPRRAASPSTGARSPRATGPGAGRHATTSSSSLGGNDLAGAQRDRALDDQGNGDDGSEEQEPDGPAGGLDDREQRVSLSLFWLLGADCKAKGCAAASFRDATTVAEKCRVRACL